MPSVSLLTFCGLLSFHSCHAAFTWAKTPGTVHACVSGNATFPWRYDSTVYDVSMIYWHFVDSGNTVLGKVIKPAVKLDYYFDQYRERAVPMDPKLANAGLVLQDLTPEDAGDYRVELSGPAGAVGVAKLIVHSDAAVELSIANKETTFSEDHPVTWSEKNTVTLLTHEGRKADISIQFEDEIPVFCSMATVCSAAVVPSDYRWNNLTVKMRVAYQACAPRDYVIFLTPEGGAAPDGGLTKGAIVGIAIAGVLVVIVIIMLVCLLCRRRRGRRDPKDKRTIDVKVRENEETVPEEKALLTVTNENHQILDVVEAETKPSEKITQGATPESIKKKAEEDQKPPTEGDTVAELPGLGTEGDTGTELPALEELYREPLLVQELAKLGFTFNDKGELRTIEDDQPFEFNLYDNKSANQRRYEDLGEAITEYIYAFMEEKLKLEKVVIPVGADPTSTNAFFYASKDAWKQKKLLVLIHGSGVVRAGQWARRLIINDSLDKGSQFPYIHWGLRNGYGIVSLNSNLNRDILEQKLKESETPEQHATYVWDKFIAKSVAKDIAIVAHSYGGCIVTDLAMTKDPEFFDQVFAVALTDSAHSAIRPPNKASKFLAEHSVNWVTSSQALDTPLQSYSRYEDSPRVSAGHTKHEWTSYSAMASVFKFIENKYNQRIQA